MEDMGYERKKAATRGEEGRMKGLVVEAASAHQSWRLKRGR